MNKDEALKLALEALEGVLDDAPKVLDASIAGGLYEVVQCRDAITAIKEALAQPEQDGKCKYCTDGCPACDARKLPEQERFLVATIGNWGRVEWADGVFPSLGDKMYSAPRTWVGLTEDEAFACQGRDYFETYKAIEARLKEKNT